MGQCVEFLLQLLHGKGMGILPEPGVREMGLVELEEGFNLIGDRMAGKGEMIFSRLERHGGVSSGQGLAEGIPVHFPQAA